MEEELIGYSMGALELCSCHQERWGAGCKPSGGDEPKVIQPSQQQAVAEDTKTRARGRGAVLQSWPGLVLRNAPALAPCLRPGKWTSLHFIVYAEAAIAKPSIGGRFPPCTPILHLDHTSSSNFCPSSCSLLPFCGTFSRAFPLLRASKKQTNSPCLVLVREGSKFATLFSSLLPSSPESRRRKCWVRRKVGNACHTCMCVARGVEVKKNEQDGTMHGSGKSMKIPYFGHFPHFLKRSISRRTHPIQQWTPFQNGVVWKQPERKVAAPGAMEKTMRVGS